MKLGVLQDQIDKIMAEHGCDIDVGVSIASYNVPLMGALDKIEVKDGVVYLEGEEDIPVANMRM